MADLLDKDVTTTVLKMLKELKDDARKSRNCTVNKMETK